MREPDQLRSRAEVPRYLLQSKTIKVGIQVSFWGVLYRCYWETGTFDLLDREAETFCACYRPPSYHTLHFGLFLQHRSQRTTQFGSSTAYADQTDSC